MKGANSPWSCGDVVKRVDLRRGFCFVARLRSRRRHRQYNCDSNWIGKNAAAAERGKRASNDDCDDDSLNAQKKEGAMEERGQQAARQQKFASFPESLAWITEIDLAQKKGNLSLAAAASRTKQNCCSVLLVHCRKEQGGRRSREGSEGGAHAIKVRSRYADDCCCFHSVPFFPAATQKRLTLSLSPLSPLRLD